MYTTNPFDSLDCLVRQIMASFHMDTSEIAMRLNVSKCVVDMILEKPSLSHISEKLTAKVEKLHQTLNAYGVGAAETYLQ